MYSWMYSNGQAGLSSWDLQTLQVIGAHLPVPSTSAQRPDRH